MDELWDTPQTIRQLFGHCMDLLMPGLGVFFSVLLPSIGMWILILLLAASLHSAEGWGPFSKLILNVAVIWVQALITGVTLQRMYAAMHNDRVAKELSWSIALNRV